MKKLLVLFALLLLGYAAWCSTTVIFVDRTKVEIYEYWKFVEGEASPELLLYNPTDEPISVVFRKKYRQNQNELDEYALSGDVLLRIYRIRPNDYALFADALTQIRAEYDKQLIEVLVNGENAGTYSLHRKPKKPSTLLQNGLVFNTVPNNGDLLPYELVYEQLDFRRKDDATVRIEFLEGDFYQAGFPEGEKFNNQGIAVAALDNTNMNLEQDEDFALSGRPLSKPASLLVRCSTDRSRRRVMSRDFNYMPSAKGGRTIALCIPQRITFGKGRKYRPRKAY